jgi:hypothetical protein
VGHSPLKKGLLVLCMLFIFDIVGLFVILSDTLSCAIYCHDIFCSVAVNFLVTITVNMGEESDV